MQWDTEIIVRTQFRGFHCWQSAPKEVEFLREIHRHVFHVELRLAVAHYDRDFEFFMVQAKLDGEIEWIQKNTPDIETWSCERWAQEIIGALCDASNKYEGAIRSCSVFEDNENGAIVTVRALLTHTGQLPHDKTTRLHASERDLRGRGNVRATQARLKRSKPLKSTQKRGSSHAHGIRKRRSQTG